MSAHLTGAGVLDAKNVIHSVAVAYDSKQDRIYADAEVISKSAENALELANKNNLKSIGFPTLGTGLYSVALEDCVRAIIEKSVEHLLGETRLERIGLVIYDQEQYLLGTEIATEMLK